MANMSYCMFENTSNDMQDVIDKIYEDDFHPDNLSPRERRAFDAMYDQCQIMLERFNEFEEMFYDEEAEAEEVEERRLEEFEMHKAIVGIQKAYEDFGHTFTRNDTMSTDDSYKHTFSRSDDSVDSYDSGSTDSNNSYTGD